MTLHSHPKSRLIVRLEKSAASPAPDKRRNSRGLRRREKKRPTKPARIIAYDFETSRIAVGTPEVRYLTAYGEGFRYAARVDGMRNLTRHLVNNFLVDEFVGAKFVAWFGNGYDAYFVAEALVRTEKQFVLRPYLTKNHALRGLRIIRAEDINKRNPRSWEFLDGQAMTGLAGVKLEKFLKTFAPNFEKLTGVIDFEKEEFDADNPKHCEYAMRDSEGLYHGMVAAQEIMLREFKEPLRVTMGGTCVRVFAANIPEGVTVNTPRDEVIDLIRDYVMRGGFCYAARRYSGPVWKYDLNQAYAAAMREAKLPCGFTSHLNELPDAKAGPYIAKITARKASNLIPFYYRTEDTPGRISSVFTTTEIRETWLTSIEVAQLKRERWHIECSEAWQWESGFSMTDFVNRLEKIRMTCEGGPNGAIGTMIKATGNHSYGKTTEQIEPIETVMASDCPEGYFPYFPDGEADQLENVWFKWAEDPENKDYHQPQLGAFITAHVRMVVRRAALLNPAAWLYADTDCVVFSEDVTSKLDIDAKRYGAWKVEETGADYKIIAKKVYTEVDPAKPVEKLKRSAKGMRVKELTADDFAAWFDGKAPVQQQVQRRNFVDVMRGADMFRAQARAGTGGTSIVKANRRADAIKKSHDPAA